MRKHEVIKGAANSCEVGDIFIYLRTTGVAAYYKANENQWLPILGDDAPDHLYLMMGSILRLEREPNLINLSYTILEFFERDLGELLDVLERANS